MGMELGQVFNPHGLFTGVFIPNCLVKYKGISSTAKMCWGRLKQYAGKDGAAFPSQETLAEEIGISKRQCVNVLNVLEKQGFIRRIIPNGNEKWLHKTTHYLFLWHNIFNETSTFRADSIDHSEIDFTSLSEIDCTQRESVKESRSQKPQKQPIRSLKEFKQDRSSPFSTPAEEDQKRRAEIQGGH